MTTINTEKPKVNKVNMDKTRDIEKRINSKVNQGMKYAEKIHIVPDAPVINGKVHEFFSIKKEDVMDFFKSMQLDDGKNPTFNNKVIDKEIAKIQEKLQNQQMGMKTRFKLCLEMKLLNAIKEQDKNGDGRVTEEEMLKANGMKNGYFCFTTIS